MVKLSTQIKQERLQQIRESDRDTRTERLLQQQRQEQLAEAKKKAKEINTELEGFQENVDYENYEKKYEQLSADAKKRVASPSEIKQTQGYKQYQQKKKEYKEYQEKKKEIEEYNRDVEIARKWIRKGLSPVMLGNKRQKRLYRKMRDAQYQQELRLKHPEDFPKEQLPEIYKKDPELKELVIKGRVTPEITREGRIKIEEAPRTIRKKDGKVVYDSAYDFTEKETQQILEQRKRKYGEEIDIDAKDIPVVLSEGKELPLGYGSQQTEGGGTTQLTTEGEMLRRQEESAESVGRKVFDTYSGITSGIKSGAVWGYGKAKEGFGYFDERISFDLTRSPSMPKLKLKFGKQEEPTIVENISGAMRKNIGEKSEEIEREAMGEKRITETEKDLEEKYSFKYQRAFESKYLEDVLRGELTFEEAQEKFKDSKSAEEIQKEYQKEYEESMKELRQDVPQGKKISAGLKVTGLELSQTLVKTATSPTKLALVSAGGYGVIKTAGLIPGYVWKGINVASLGYGSYKAFSPKSTIREAGAGVVMAGTSAGILGYQGIRYLRAPKFIGYKKIPYPKANLKSSQTIVRDVSKITNKGVKSATYFPKQKLSQFGIAGRRPVWTSNFRRLMSKYTDYKFKPLYRGLPSDFAKKTYALKGLRGSYRYSPKPSNYEKMFKRLTKYGYSPAEATKGLRTIYPKVKEVWIKRGYLKPLGKQGMAGEIDFAIKQPKYAVKGIQGMTTRGRGDIVYRYNINRLAKPSKDLTFFVEKKMGAKGIFTKTGKLSKFDMTPADVGAGIVKQGKPYAIGKKFYQDIATRTATRQIFPLSKKIRIDYGKTTIEKIFKDARKPNIIQRGAFKKTPLSKTFSPITKRKSYTKAVQKVADKIDDVASTKGTASGTTGTAQSQFYGTGQYERSIGGLLPQQNIQAQTDILKATITPPSPRFAPLPRTMTTPFQIGTTGVGVASISGLSVSQILKSDQALKGKLKVKTIQRDLTKPKQPAKEDTITKQDTTTKQDTGLRSQLRQVTEPPLKTTTVTPRVRPPQRPPVRRPRTRPFPLTSPALKKMIQFKQMKERKSVYERAYLPDFTARSLGLEPKQVTKKQAQKQLKELLTGFEIRKGVKLK